METSLIKLFADYWVAITLVWVFTVFILKQSKAQNDAVMMQNKIFAERMEEIARAISLIPQQLWKTHLEKNEALNYFRLVLDRHINLKLGIIWAILDRNDIHRRRTEIERQIKTQFEIITKSWAELLSQINSPCWDMWEALLSVNFDAFFDEVFSVLFRRDEHSDKYIYIRTKIKDIRVIMEGYVNDIINKLAGNGGNQ